jgi:putative flippase GtrA
MNLEALHTAVVVRLPRPIQPLARKFDIAFLRFAMVGAVGFTVDLIVLNLLLAQANLHAAHFQLGPWPVSLSPAIQARFVSFPVAVFATWLLNRSWTFRGGSDRSVLGELFSYLVVQISGGIPNVAAYSVLIFLIPALGHTPVIPLAAGSALGLCLTFVGSKYWAFRRKG